MVSQLRVIMWRPDAYACGYRTQAGPMKIGVEYTERYWRPAYLQALAMLHGVCAAQVCLCLRTPSLSLSLSVCVCVCVCVCLYVCTTVCVYVCMTVYVCVYVCMTV